MSEFSKGRVDEALGAAESVEQQRTDQDKLGIQGLLAVVFRTLILCLDWGLKLA